MDNNIRLAKEIMEHVGGEANITSMTHCATRLRLQIKNEETFEAEEIKKIAGVLDVVKSMNGYQIVIGNNVSKVYNEISKEYKIEAGVGGGRVASNPLEAVLNAMSDIMGPVLPAVIAAGLVSALLAIFSLLGMDSSGSTYQILYSLSQAPLYFLPFLIAYSSAKHWKLSPVLALTIAGVMMYPSFTALVEAGEPITFFGLPVTASSYASSLIPMILTCWAMYYVNKLINKIVPDFLRFVFVPLLTLVIMVPIALCITGPVGSWIGILLHAAINFLYAKVPSLTIIILSALTPFMILTGSHLALLSISMTNMAVLGYDNTLLVAFIGMNFSQFAVSLAVLLKAKNTALKSTALSTCLSAALGGVTEPALYGLCLRLKKPLAATFIGCIANGIYCAIFGVKFYAFVPASFSALPAMIDPAGSNNFILGVGAVIVTIVVTVAATWILGFDESSFEEKM